MTIREMEVSKKDFLTPKDVAEAMGADQQTLRVCAKQCPERLGFPFAMIGNRMKISRVGFLNWYYGKPAEVK